MAGETLMVVDDNPVNLTMLARRLERVGFKVVKAQGGQEAINLLQDKDSDVELVLLDLFMPDVSGIDVLDWVRGNRATEGLPVIMVSAATEIPRVVEAMQRGASDYVTKPIDFEKTLESVNAHLARRQASAPGKLQQFGHYRVEELIGRGGMSQVYRGIDTRLDRAVALKVLTSEVARDPELLERFHQEAKAVARLQHPGVVGIYEIGTEPSHYIAMELIQGHDLEDELGRRPKFSPLEARGTVYQILEALAAVHDCQIVHRDLKPSNVMLETNGRVRLMDFGLAKLLDTTLHLTQKGDIWGTPYYLAPEQVDPNFGPIDERADLFAVGTILYRMLTGQNPVKAASNNLAAIAYEIIHRKPDPPTSLDASIPPALSDLCMRALEKDKSKRFATARDFAHELTELDL
jgi:serine/threonine protein kinase